MFDSFFNAIFGWAINLSPVFGILIISLILTFIITLAYKYLTNQEEMKEMKDQLKTYQKKMKELKNNPKKLMEVQKESMQINMKYMVSSFKPMIITFIPIIIIFGWLNSIYKPMGQIIWKLSWIWVYIVFSLIFSIILRKLIKVY